MPEKDYTEKTLESYADVFADIVNGLLFHGKKVVSEESLTDAMLTSMYKAEDCIHEQERDTAKYWNNGRNEKAEVRIAFFGIENQTAYDRDMPLRIIGYDGAAYRSELEGKDRYPVLTLILYFGDRRWGRNRSLYDAVAVPDMLRPFVNDYPIHVFEMAYLTEEQVRCFHSDFRIVADYFSKKRTNPDYRPENPEAFRHVDELLKLFTVLTGDRRFAETLKEEGGKPANMCEVLDRVEARGLRRGREEGRREGSLAILADLVRNDIIPVELGAEKAGITVEEFRKAAKI